MIQVMQNKTTFVTAYDAALLGLAHLDGPRLVGSAGCGGFGGLLLFRITQHRPVHVGAQFLALDACDGFDVWAVIGRDAALFPLINGGVPFDVMASLVELSHKGGHAVR